MLTATMDERRRATAADKIAYLIILVCVGVVWLFGVYVGWFMLSMSGRGRFDGGLLMNGVLTVYVLVWLVAITSFHPDAACSPEPRPSKRGRGSPVYRSTGLG